MLPFSPNNTDPNQSNNNNNDNPQPFFPSFSSFTNNNNNSQTNNVGCFSIFPNNNDHNNISNNISGGTSGGTLMNIYGDNNNKNNAPLSALFATPISTSSSSATNTTPIISWSTTTLNEGTGGATNNSNTNREDVVEGDDQETTTSSVGSKPLWEGFKLFQTNDIANVQTNNRFTFLLNNQQNWIGSGLPTDENTVKFSNDDNNKDKVVIGFNSSERIGRSTPHNVFSFSPVNYQNSNAFPTFPNIPNINLDDSKGAKTSVLTSTTPLQKGFPTFPLVPPPTLHPTNFGDSTISSRRPSENESSFSGNSQQLTKTLISHTQSDEELAKEMKEEIEHVDRNMESTEKWIKEERYKSLKRNILVGVACSIVLFCVLVASVSGFVSVLENFRKGSIRETTKYNLLLAESGIKRQIEVAITALDNIRESVISWDYNVDNNRFDGFAERITQYNFYDVIHTFGMTRNFTLTSTYPSNVLKSLVGQEIGTDPSHLQQLLISIETNRTTIFGPFLTVDNMYALIAQQPILDSNLQFWGFALVVLEFADIFSKVNLTSLLHNYSIQFIDNNQGEVFYQRILKDHESYDLNNLNGIIFESKNISIINSSWRFTLIPIETYDGTVLALEILIPVVVIFFGIAGLMGVSTSYSYYTLRVKANREAVKQFSAAEALLKKKLDEWSKALQEAEEKYTEEEKKFKQIVNSLEDALITVLIGNNSTKYTVIDINTSFTNMFGFDKDDVDEKKIDYLKVLPNFKLINEYKNYEKRHENREYAVTYSQVEVLSKTGEVIPSTITLTFDKAADTVFCVLLIKPLTAQAPKEFCDLEMTLEQNQKQFMEMFENSDKRRSFTEFIRKDHRKQDDRNLLFIENVLKYKHSVNIQERHNLMDCIIQTYMYSSSNEKLYDVSEDGLKSFFKKFQRCPGQLDLFDGMVSIVIQQFFNYGLFERWQQYEQAKNTKSFIKSIVKSVIP